MKPHLLLLLNCFLCLSIFAQTGATIPELIPFRDGDKWGFSDKDKKIIVPCEYDKTHPLENGIGIFEKDGREGYVNSAGTIVIAPDKYRSIKIDPNFNVFYVTNAAGQYGIIDFSGKEIIPTGKYAGLSDFNEFGQASIREDNEKGLLNTAGEEMIPIGTYDGFKIDKESGFIRAYNDDKYGILDKDGKVYIDVKYEEALILENDYFLVQKKGKRGTFLKNKVIIEPDFETLKYANEDLFYFETKKSKGFINAEGEKIFEGIDKSAQFNDGFAIVKKDAKVGVINTKGEVIIDFGKYDSVKKLEYDVFVIRKDGKNGVVNKSGKEIIAPDTYQRILDFSGGFAIVVKDAAGAVDTEGNEILPCIYEGIEKVVDAGYKSSLTVKDPNYVASDVIAMSVYNDGKHGLFNAKGKELLPIEYDKISTSYAHGNTVVMKHYPAHSKYLYGYYNVVEERETSPVKYLSAEHFRVDNDHYPSVLIKDSEYTFINSKGEVLINPSDVYNSAKIINGNLLLIDGRSTCSLIDMKTGKDIIPIYTFKELMLAKDKSLLGMAKEIETTFETSWKYGLVGLDGKEITPAKYDKIIHYASGDFIDNELIKVRIDGNDGYVGRNGIEYFKD